MGLGTLSDCHVVSFHLFKNIYIYIYIPPLGFKGNLSLLEIVFFSRGTEPQMEGQLPAANESVHFVQARL